jgi:TnpA family transposase
MYNSEEKNEAFKAFKDLLVPIVRDALRHNEAIDKLYWAAHYAYALQDMVAGKRLMHNDVVKSDMHSTDTHGYAETIFGTTYLLGIAYAPRIKNFQDQTLYGFEKRKRYEAQGFSILPEKGVNLETIQPQWDQILRFVATIKLKETTASQLFRRLSSYSHQHPLYRALKAFGQITKSIFLLRYIDDHTLRQAIEKQLNKLESANKFSKAVFYGNNQEFQQETKEEQIIAEGCKRLIQNAIICWNYLYLSEKVANTAQGEQRNQLLVQIKNSSVVTWQHINLHGEFDFSDEKLKGATAFHLTKIMELKVA